jgi:uncharacterized membrane protein
MEHLSSESCNLKEVNMDTETPNPAVDSTHKHHSCSKSCFSPTVKGVLIGAVAGSVLPVLGTFSGAIIGGISGKLYEKKCKNKCHKN